MHSFLQIISFWVSVPVLSVIRNYNLPRSSGTLELRAIAPLMSLSVLMQCMYQSLAKSKLTLKLIGMILDISRMTLNK